MVRVSWSIQIKKYYYTCIIITDFCANDMYITTSAILGISTDLAQICGCGIMKETKISKNQVYYSYFSPFLLINFDHSNAM